MFCPRCGIRQPEEHRFCVSCGGSLPREMLSRRGPKVSRWFWGMPVAPTDPPNSALRVSRYLEEVEMRTEEGSVRVPAHHVRFSIWEDDHAVAAMSVSDDEAERLVAFLAARVADPTPEPDPRPAPGPPRGEDAKPAT